MQLKERLGHEETNQIHNSIKYHFEKSIMVDLSADLQQMLTLRLEKSNT